MKRRILVYCLVALVPTTLAAQSAADRIDLAEFQNLHAARKVLVVDVRDAQSFASGHIPGAINVPLGSEEQAAFAAKLKGDKRPIVTYCA